MDKIRAWRARSGAWWRQQTDAQRKTAKILAALAVVAALSALLPAFLAGDWAGLFLNLGTELGGAVVTFILINRIIGGGEERERLKADLIARMRSQVNEVAVQAVEELRRHGWLTDGSLHAMNLQSAKLQGADLRDADLQGVNLWFGNLRKASLFGVCLGGAFLQYARLHGAYLHGGDLMGADLGHVDLENAKLIGTFLEGANLHRANLRGANLAGANLEGANLEEANFNEDTVLPDGTNWTPDTDMLRFSDPVHPDFWRPDNDWSPAFRGRSDQANG